MANKKINELLSRTPSLTDLMLIGDPSSGYSYKTTVNDIALEVENIVAGSYVTLATAQTISGAKTFSNVLTLTSVANSSVDTDKFLVLTGTNTVNYRTGTQVLSDIGGQGALTLTTTGTSGAATLVGNTLNIPNYAPDLSGYVPTYRTLTINGTAYDLSADRTWSVGTVTSVAATAGTGISISGSPITSSGTLTITNTAPDQTVVLTSGTGINVTGTYPSFTIAATNNGTVTSVALATGTTGTDISVSGSPITSSGTITLNIPTASATNRGALSSTDWSTFNNKQGAITLTTTGSSGAATFVANTLNIPNYTLSGLGGVPTSRTLTINGTAFDLSADRSWSIGTVTSVGLSSATSGVTIGSTPITTSGTITLAIATASGTQQGLLSSTDWTTFNNKQNALTNPVTGTGNANRIAMFTGTSTIGNSSLYYDATYQNIGIKTAGGPITFKNYSALSFDVNAISGNSTTLQLTRNVSEFDGWLYLNGSAPAMFQITGGNDFTWSNSTSGTAGTTITWNERMRLDASGNLALGGNFTSINSTLQVTGNAAIGYTSAAPSSGLIVSGSVGIGTSSPAAKLTLNSTGETKLLIQTSNPSGNSDVVLEMNGNYYYSSIIRNNSAGSIKFQTGTTDRLILDASGNLGLGVSPSAWNTVTPVFQIGYTAFSAYQNTQAIYSSNGVYTSGWKYLSNTNATYYSQNEAGPGIHAWFNAPSGTAGNAISFTQAMTLDASGRLGIGTTSPNTALDVNGTINVRTNGYQFGRITTNNNDGENGGLTFQYIASNVFTNGMVLNQVGNVGIGTTSPTGKLHSYIGDITAGNAPASSGTTPVNAMLNLTNNRGVGMYFGGSYSGSYAQWIQVADVGNLGVYYPLALNPNGGNVGIGTTSPTNGKLVVKSGESDATGIVLERGSNTQKLVNIYSETADGKIALASGGSVSATTTIFLNSAGSSYFNGGNVGIGTISPQSYTNYRILHLAGPATNGSGLLYLTNSDNSIVGMAFAEGSAQRVTFGSQTNHPVTFLTNDTEQMRITSGGELLINTTSDAGDYKLQVNGNAYVSGTSYLSGNVGLGTSADGSYKLYVSGNSYFAGNIETSGSIKTGDPSGFTAKPWKLGDVTVTSITVDTDKYISVDINGTVYNIPTCHPN